MNIYIRYLTSILVAIAALLPETANAQIQAAEKTAQPTATASQNDALAAMDSVEISLLTCSPGEQIWSLYGHTAIRFVDKLHHTDLAINYGLFDYSQKYFYLRFTFGRTDYQMGIEPMELFLQEYTDDGRGVIQQRLNLSREEKMAIAQALSENYTPINRVYRYNYFYDNCTTRARDIITNHLNGKVEYVVNAKVSPTWRQLVHQWNDGHPWMKFGCDLLLGVGADRKTDFAQQQFIPDTLRKDFDKAFVVEPSGHKHKLVASTDYILRPDPSRVKTSNNIWDTVTPRVFIALLFVITLAISAIDYRRKKTTWLFDTVLLTLNGLAGIILFAMIFSTHPTVRVNLQILLLNPLSLCFVYSITRSSMKARFSKYWNILMACTILFAIGGIFQDYAEGMYLLACSLFIRFAVNRTLYYNKQKGK